MTELYNATVERLWEKIEYHREELDLDSIDFKAMFPYDQLAKMSPLINDLVAEVNKEFYYEMSEHQISCAVFFAIRYKMEEYSRCNELSLVPRP